MLAEMIAPLGAPEAAAITAELVHRRSPISVLLVEDDPDIGAMYGLGLRLKGHTVRVVANGLEVADEVARLAPDVIVLDVELPGLDGLEVLKLLKGGSKSAEIPVLLLSNLPLHETVSRAHGLGAAHFALKAETTPGELERLLNTLRALPPELSSPGVLTT
jgi:DNA-binding response OmpR family regulator